MSIKLLLDKARTIGDEIQFMAESTYRSTIDKVDDVVDFTSAAFLKTYAGIVGTFEAIKYAGLTVAIVTAPVPTLVALSILWLMELSIDSAKSDIDKELNNKSKKREFDRIVGLLKRYGKIPKTSIVETEFVHLEIDAVEGNVSGTILKGQHQGKALSEFDEQELINLALSAPDQETKTLLEAYISYSEKIKCQN